MGMTERSQRRGGGSHTGVTRLPVSPAPHGPHSTPQAGAALHWRSLGCSTGPAPQVSIHECIGEDGKWGHEGALQSSGVHQGCTVGCVRAGDVQVGLGG